MYIKIRVQTLWRKQSTFQSVGFRILHVKKETKGNHLDDNSCTHTKHFQLQLSVFLNCLNGKSPPT